jgi:hypothetical protein
MKTLEKLVLVAMTLVITLPVIGAPMLVLVISIQDTTDGIVLSVLFMEYARSPMARAGFVDVARLDEVFFQPALVGSRPS